MQAFCPEAPAAGTSTQERSTHPDPEQHTTFLYSSSSNTPVQNRVYTGKLFSYFPPGGTSGVSQCMQAQAGHWEDDKGFFWALLNTSVRTCICEGQQEREYPLGRTARITPQLDVAGTMWAIVKESSRALLYSFVPVFIYKYLYLHRYTVFSCFITLFIESANISVCHSMALCCGSWAWRKDYHGKRHSDVGLKAM